MHKKGVLSLSVLSERIDGLCAQHKITGYRLCKDIGISPNVLTELRSGRREGISAKNANKIAAYFEVSVGYLLGTEDDPGIKKDAPTGNADERDLDASLVRRLVQLTPEEMEKVDAFVQGILASR